MLEIQVVSSLVFGADLNWTRIVASVDGPLPLKRSELNHGYFKFAHLYTILKLIKSLTKDRSFKKIHSMYPGLQLIEALYLTIL